MFSSLAEQVLQDVRFMARTLLRNPGFTITVVLTLALGIGANAAIFTVIRGVLLKPLAYREPQQLVDISGGATPERYQQLRRDSHVFSGVGAYHGLLESLTLADSSAPEVLKGTRVSANFLSILGVKPLLGRGFLPQEDLPAAPPVALISHALWKTRFDRDPYIAGKTAILAAMPYTIVGVLPAGFSFPFEKVDVWLPKPAEHSTLSPRSRRLSPLLKVFARLKPHVTAQQATAELRVINR